MGRGHKQSAFFTGNIQIFLHLCFHLFRRSEGHDGLGADCAVKRKAVPILLIDFSKIHTFRLYGIQHIDSRFNQIGNHGLHITAGMVKDNQVRLHFPGGIDHTLQAGLQPFVIELRAHHQGMLHPDVIPQKQDVRTGLRIQYRPLNGHLRNSVQQNLRFWVI